LELHVALGEIVRNIERRDLVGFRFTEIRVEFQAVLDCRNLETMGLTLGDLLDDIDYAIPRALATAAIARGAEGILVPSASLLGDNLIVFPHRLRPGSSLEAVRSIDPRLNKRQPAE
jgi:RES domain